MARATGHSSSLVIFGIRYVLTVRPVNLVALVADHASRDVLRNRRAWRAGRRRRVRLTRSVRTAAIRLILRNSTRSMSGTATSQNGSQPSNGSCLRSGGKSKHAKAPATSQIQRRFSIASARLAGFDKVDMVASIVAMDASSQDAISPIEMTRSSILSTWKLRTSCNTP